MYSTYRTVTLTKELPQSNYVYFFFSPTLVELRLEELLIPKSIKVHVLQKSSGAIQLIIFVNLARGIYRSHTPGADEGDHHLIDTKRMDLLKQIDRLNKN